MVALPSHLHTRDGHPSNSSDSLLAVITIGVSTFIMNRCTACSSTYTLPRFASCSNVCCSACSAFYSLPQT